MKAPVPRVFHFVFGLRPQTVPFHLVYYICLKSCLEVNKPETILFHYQNEPWGRWWDRIKPLLTLRQISPNRFIESYQYRTGETEYPPVCASVRFYPHGSSV